MGRTERVPPARLRVVHDLEGTRFEGVRELSILDLVGCAVRAAADKKAEDVTVLDVQEQLGITDYFVVCSGTNERQVRTIAEEVHKQLKAMGEAPRRREGDKEGGWILLDYGDFIVHIFGSDEREYYDLERLWKDAPRVSAQGAEAI